MRVAQDWCAKTDEKGRELCLNILQILVRIADFNITFEILGQNCLDIAPRDAYDPTPDDWGGKKKRELQLESL